MNKWEKLTVEIPPITTLVCSALFHCLLQVHPMCNLFWWENIFLSPIVNGALGFVLIHHCDTQGCGKPVTVYHICYFVCQYYVDLFWIACLCVEYRKFSNSGIYLNCRFMQAYITDRPLCLISFFVYLTLFKKPFFFLIWSDFNLLLIPFAVANLKCLVCLSLSVYLYICTDSKFSVKFQSTNAVFNFDHR